MPTGPCLPSISRRFVLAGLTSVAGAGGAASIACAGPYDLQIVADGVARALMGEHDIPGLAIGMTHNGRASVFVYGVRGRDTGAPVTPDTLFEVGSVSKVYTALLGGFARASGRLDWSDPVSRHLPELTGARIGEVSLLNLGTYTAGGLPLQFPDTAETDDDAVDWLRTWEPEAVPGTVRQYSNPSIGLFGRAVAAAIGGPFEQALEREVIAELGLEKTFVEVPSCTLDDYAWGYARDGRAVHVSPGPFDAEAYGIKTSVTDLLRVVALNLDSSSLSESARRAIAETRRPYFQVADHLMQGLGWEQYALPLARETLLAGNSPEVIFDPQPVRPLDPAIATGPTLFNKTGSTGGFGAYAAFVPSRALGVVILANRNYPISARVDAAHRLLLAADAAALS